MTPRIGSALVGLAAVLLAGTSLRAEDTGLSTAFKVRGALQLSSPKDGLTNRTLGFGLEAGLPAHGGKWIAELGFSYKGGYIYRQDPALIGRGNGVTLADAGGNINVETRKNKLEGITLRVGFEAPVNETLSWRAGLQLGGSKFTHQVIGQSVGTANGTAFKTPYYSVSSENSLVPSPYAGITWALDKTSAVEVGVLLHSFKARDYKHVAGPTTAKDTIATPGRLLPHLEAAYVFRF